MPSWSLIRDPIFKASLMFMGVRVYYRSSIKGFLFKTQFEPRDACRDPIPHFTAHARYLQFSGQASADNTELSSHGEHLVTFELLCAVWYLRGQRVRESLDRILLVDSMEKQPWSYETWMQIISCPRTCTWTFVFPAMYCAPTEFKTCKVEKFSLLLT